MDKKFGILVAVLVVAAALLIAIPTLLGVQGAGDGKEAPEFTIGEYSNKTTSEKPGSFNVEEYAFFVSSEKPEVVVAEFTEEESISKQGTELTVYNQNLALVKEIRFLDLRAGLNLVKYTDIAERIKADTVLFKDLEDESTFVVEQNYEYDIVSKSKLLDKYLDKEITIKTKDGQVYTGKLLSHSTAEGLDQILLETEEKVISLNEVLEIYFPELTEGLITKPSLVWKLYTGTDGNRQTQTTYLTEGMTWEADYIAKINNDDTQLYFNGWVTIDNKSGTSYPNTSLKLMAGDLHLAGEETRYKVAYEYEGLPVPTAAPQQFTEESLYEYHMYTLERMTDIQNNETKQISLLSAPGVAVEKKFVFDPLRRGWYRSGSTEEKKIKVMLEFKNSEETGLGMPLPKGTVRVYKEDSQGKLQFVGEDRIDHTPKDEEIELLTGYAFDVVAEKKTTKEDRISDKCREYSYEVEVRNHKDEAITVYCVEHTYGDNEVIRASHSYEAEDAYTYEFAVEVPANGEATLTYTIRTCW